MGRPRRRDDARRRGGLRPPARPSGHGVVPRREPGQLDRVRARRGARRRRPRRRQRAARAARDGVVPRPADRLLAGQLRRLPHARDRRACTGVTGILQVTLRRDGSLGRRRPRPGDDSSRATGSRASTRPRRRTASSGRCRRRTSDAPPCGLPGRARCCRRAGAWAERKHPAGYFEAWRRPSSSCETVLVPRMAATIRWRRSRKSVVGTPRPPSFLMNSVAFGSKMLG